MSFRNILITGASTGIGRELAIAYGKQGAHVWLMARSEDKLLEVAHTIVSAGGSADILPSDVTRTENYLKDLQKAERDSGGIELAIANAGISARIKYPSDHNLEIMQQIIAVNYTAVILCLEFFAQKMLPRGRGQLVGISSVAGFRAMPGSAPYSSAKKGISTFMEGLRFSMKHFGIKVTDVRPGFVRTPLTDKNSFPMPMMIDADKAAHKIMSAISRGRKRYTFPWPLAIGGHLIQSIPDSLYDLLAQMIGGARAVDGARSKIKTGTENPFTLS